MREGVLPDDCCVIGGGVIGLSIARELAGRGRTVTVLSRGRIQESSSWAAAGILPPAPMPADAAASPGDALTAGSDLVLRAWSTELRDETGIDNGLRFCGGLHLAADAARLDSLEREHARWIARGAHSDLIDAADVAEAEPALAEAVAAGAIAGGMVLDDETQIRPPRHLAAVAASCRARGVRIVEEVEAVGFERDGRRIIAVDTPRGRFSAGTWILAAGAWSQSLAPGLGLAIRTRPIRGQIALFAPGGPSIGRVINHGLDYLVQRDDGRTLVGSTLEDAGFDPRTTPEEIGRLLGVAARLVPALAHVPVETTWAGLRPGSEDGLPFIGFVPGHDDAIIAAGHFRAGLHQSAGTALLVADLVEGRTPWIDPAPFAPGRPAVPASESVVEDYLAKSARA